jgi:hypothetical protein
MNGVLSRLIWSVWLLLFSSFLAFAVPNRGSQPSPPSFGYDECALATIAYDAAFVSDFAYDSASAFLADEKENSTAKISGIFARLGGLVAASAGARFSRVGGAAGDFLVPGEATLQAGLRDPALYGTRLTTTPTFNPALHSLGRVTGRGLNASVDIGPGAFSSRGNLIQTIIHEETHIRLDLRAAQGSQRAIRIQSTLTAEEAYVEAVAQRFWQRYGGR